MYVMHVYYFLRKKYVEIYNIKVHHFIDILHVQVICVYFANILCIL